MTIIKLGHYQQVPYFYNAIGIQRFSKIIVKFLKRKLVIYFYAIDLALICLLTPCFLEQNRGWRKGKWCWWRWDCLYYAKHFMIRWCLFRMILSKEQCYLWFFSFFLDLSLIGKSQSALKPREITFYNVRICRDNIMK